MDPRYRLSGVIQARSGQYLVTSANLEAYLRAKKPTTLTKAELRRSGRGVAYTTPHSRTCSSGFISSSTRERAAQLR